MEVPDLRQDGKADGESKEPFHRHQQLFKRARHFQRNHQQRNGESKDGVSKALQPRDLTAAPAKMRFRWDQVSACAFVEHGRYCATASITVGDGVSVPNSPSQRAITALARQLPRTLVAVRAMSMNWSMPRISRTGQAGR